MAEEKRNTNRLFAPVDICELEDKILLWAEMPGVGKDGLEIKVDGNELEILGDVKKQTEGKYMLTECPREGHYHRIFTISDDVDTTKIAAKLTDGVLELSLAKKEHAKPREIPINTE